MITLLKSQLSRWGGAEKFTWRLAHYFAAKNMPVTLLTSGDLPSTKHPRIQCVALPDASPLSFRRLILFDRCCQEYLKQHPTPIVFGLDRNAQQTHLRASNGVHAAYLKKGRGSEGLWKTASFYINPLHRTLLNLEKKAFEQKSLQKLFVNSYMVRDELLSHYRVDPGKVQVVHNGVEWEEMAPAFLEWGAKKQEMLSLLKLDPDAYQLLFIGHNFQRKGLDQLLQGLSLLKGEKVHLTVIGKDKRLSHYKNLIHKLGLDKKVTLLAPEKAIAPFYQMADALVIPSLYDPFANVTVEALAMGLSVVSSLTNGGHEILTEETGVKIETLFDPDAVAEALRSVLKRRKTEKRALQIRSAVAHLDFSSQLSSFYA